jgi:hypothetical protein
MKKTYARRGEAKAGQPHLLLHKGVLILSNAAQQGSKMPMGATLALRMKARGFIRGFEGASLRSSVPHRHFAPLLGHVGWVNRLFILG